MPANSKMGFIKPCLVSLGLVLAFGVGAEPAPSEKLSTKEELTPSASPAPSPVPIVGARQLKLPFTALGSNGPINMRGTSGGPPLSFGVRLDEAVSSARLKFDYTYSPAMLFDLSHIKIFLNDELVSTLKLDKANAGLPQSRIIDLDPRFFTDFNHLRFELVGHYTVTNCEDPMHSSLWAQISQSSELLLGLTPIKVPNELALLPAPFFDPHDTRRLTLPFVLPAAPSPLVQQVAGTVASWFGAQASYRQSRFPVSARLPSDQHAVLFALKGQAPAGLTLPEINGPTLAEMTNPAAPNKKILLVSGRTEAELQTAARALVLGQVALSGSVAKVGALDMGPARKLYDAPNWMPTDRPVRVGELVNGPSDLQVDGYSGDPIRINLRLPADLSPWQSKGVPMDLKYRFTAPAQQDDSILNVEINKQLVDSFRLKPSDKQGQSNRISVPLLGSDSALNSLSLLIPAFRVGSDNQMQFTFKLQPNKSGACTGGLSNSARAGIDPDSTLDFSALPHFAAMPNLAFFVNSGFPFTRYADLSDTAIVMPDKPAAVDLEALVTLLGYMGKWTGIPTLRVEVLPASQVSKAANKNLIVIGTGSASDLLQRWRTAMPVLLKNGRIELAPIASPSHFWGAWMLEPNREEPSATGRQMLTSNGGLAVLEGFESPFNKGLSVVALMASQPDELRSALNAMEDAGQVNRINGDVVLIRGGTLESFHLGETYYIGQLPIWKLAWFHLSRYPMLVAAGGIIAGLALALLLFMFLSRIAARRLGS